MTVYLSYFFFVAFIAVYTSFYKNIDKRILKLFWFSILFISVFLIGFRYEVGGDWISYMKYINYYEVENTSMSTIFTQKEADPGYKVLMVLSLFIYHIILPNSVLVKEMMDFSWSIVILNTISALIIIFGIYKISILNPFPFLSFLISVPYLIVGVSIGYSRQAIALGFFLIGISYLIKKRYLIFLLLTILGSTFHITLLPLVVIGLYNVSKKYFFVTISILIFLLSIYLSYSFSIFGSLFSYFPQYIGLHSRGGTIRACLTLLPALTYIFYYNNLKKYEDSYFWFIFSILTVIITFICFSLSTTIADRVLIYFAVIQLIFWPRFCNLFNEQTKNIIILVIIIFYVLMFYSWLALSPKSYRYWIPYQNAIYHQEGIRLEVIKKYQLVE